MTPAPIPMTDLKYSRALKNENIKNGQKWYAVNKEMLKGEKGKSKFVKNSYLVDQNGRINPKYKKGVDYDFVSAEDWEIFKKNGFEVEIERKVIETEKGFVLEENPVLVTFYFEKADLNVFENCNEDVEVSDRFVRKCTLVSSEDFIFSVVETLFLDKMPLQEFKEKYEVRKPNSEKICPEQKFKYLNSDEIKLIISSKRKNLNTSLIFLKQKGSGLCGLFNLGNTCFMNSGIQCLNVYEEFIHYFIEESYKMHINKENPLGSKGRLAIAFSDLLREMWLENKTVVMPGAFKRVLGNETGKFVDFQEQDATELLDYILNFLHEDLCYGTNSKKEIIEENPKEYWKKYLEVNRSIITELFYGQVLSSLECMECGEVGKKYEPFMYLTVPIPEKKKFHFGVFLSFDSDNRIPIKILAEIDWTVEELKKAIKLRYATKLDILCVSVKNNKIVEILKESTKLSSVKTNIYCYEIDKEWSPENYIWLNIKILAYIFLNYNFNFIFLLKLENNTVEHIYEKIVSKIEPFINSSNIVFGYEKWKDKFEVKFSKKEKNINNFGFVTAFFKDSEFTDLFGKNFNIEKNLVNETEKNLNIYDCIELFTKKEILKGVEAVFCEKCNKSTNRSKKLDIVYLPKYFIVHLKRFCYYKGYEEKIGIFIDFPLEDLRIGNYKYNCRAICNHYELGAGAGHYTAYIKREEWYCMNDSIVMKINDVKKENAYILFYEREE
ncbi:ubiquitin carboxyl-terminal hydrolase [Hamiltosporidium magnivora]|uniref:ubiquitinyl hydrolase 1 n=1 Tax=Hamiltosporidium magnivora TaxID=148818 RepID=A0A4V2JUR3_9MICR|nr:ubiquitin carboxyl-terminal hydrolase [Hamiltosporidium magnivora]